MRIVTYMVCVKHKSRNTLGQNRGERIFISSLFFVVIDIKILIIAGVVSALPT